MDQTMQKLAAKMLLNKRQYRRWLAVFLLLAMLVSLGTATVFRHPSVAMTNPAVFLDCPLVVHQHDASCYDEAGNLICGLADYVVHSHNESCYDAEGNLVCTLPEIGVHFHDDSCYTEEQVLICGLEENGGHTHSEACYTAVQGELLCEDESEEHEHTDDCYAWTQELSCGMEEGEGAHTHSEACYETRRVLSCGQQSLHTHDASCYDEAGNLICGQLELTAHTHSEACFTQEMPEPISDPTADVETEAEWTAAFAGLTLSGNWGEDLVTIAKTQVGYTESDKNFEITDGVQRGWTRYGAWAGFPYGDWCAMFVSFCLQYAGIPEEQMPRNMGTQTWIEALTEKGLYTDDRNYIPKTGDLVFYEFDGAYGADHMGIVTAVDGDRLEVIEGNSDNAVQLLDRHLTDAEILGYGILPENPDGISYPAQRFEGAAGDVTVTVEADAGAFPAGTTMTVTAVEDQAVIDSATAAVEGEVKRVHAVDITFYNADGEEIEPRIPIRVSMSTGEITAQEETPVVVHVDNAGEASLVERKQEETAPENEIVFEADAFSVYAIVYTEIKTRVLTADGQTYEITVSFEPDAGIPEDAKLVVKEIPANSERFAGNVDLVNKKLAANEVSEVLKPVQFDISIVSGEETVEPKEGSHVSVEIKLVKALFEEEDSEEEEPSAEADGEIPEDEKGLFLINGQVVSSDSDDLTWCRVAHIAEGGNTEIIDEVENTVTDDMLVLHFDTESFSDYLFDGNNGNGLYNLPNTIYVGDEIYMWHQANMWVSNIGSTVTETKHNNSDNFKTVTAINPGRFRIYNRYNTGEYKEITVLPARTGTTPPATIDTVQNASVGIKLNLFDYDLDNSLDSYFNNYNHGDHPVSAVFLNEYGSINNGHNLKFWGSGIGNNHGSQNQYQEHGVTSIVRNTLDTGNAGGYPVLNADGTSLNYLFTPSDGTDKKAYTNVDGLFKKVGDYYVYDSNQNYAWYNPLSNSFDVYSSTYEQKSSGEQNSSTNGKAIGFFPFHPWDDEYDLYVNWNKKLNHHFGLSMSVPFSLPKDPKAVVDTDGNPIVFEFSGDDDMWVFIDGKLAMDIGGIHQPTSGTINFKNGTVTVNGSRQTSFTSSDFNKLFDGEKHTLEVFYIERGGCDSNCKIQFNLTQYGHVHFDKVDKDNPSDKLAGAVFGIYKDSECTTPLMEQLKNETSRAYVAESDANGHVQFSDIPLGTYYLKELHAPEGYPEDDTIHTIQVYLDQQTGAVKVKVTIDGADVESGVKILNGKPAPITLGLRKEWQNTDGESITAPADANATFEIKRIRTYETYTETVVEGSGRDVSHLTVGWIRDGVTHIYEEFDLIAGSQTTVSWRYNDSYTGSKDCILNGNRIDKDYVSGNIVSHAFPMPAAGQTATFYIVDESTSGVAFDSINVAGSQFYGNTGGGVVHSFETKSEPDPDFHYTGEHVTNNRVTLPINENTWQYIFSNLPTFGRGNISGVDHGVAFNYFYYLEEVDSVSPEGTTVVYKDLSGNPISTPIAGQTSTSGTQTIINRVPSGYLQINKAVTYNGQAPTTAEQKSALAGTYEFTVCTDEDCLVPYKLIQGAAPNQQQVDLTLSVTILENGEAQSSNVVKLPVGEYWLREENPSQTGVTPDENHIHVTVTEDNTTQEPAIVEFTNNKIEDKNPDEMAIDIEKTFAGIASGKIPGNFHPVLTYYLPGSSTPVTVPLGETHGSITRTISPDGMTWHWHVIQIPIAAERFAISEQNYTITGYERVTTINGGETPVEHPDQPQSVEVLVPEIDLVQVTTTSDYTTPDNHKAFYLTDGQILLVRMTSNATVVVSQHSLSKATRTALENAIHENGGKIPGDNSPKARWVENYVYYSKEVHGSSFSYGGRTIYFGDNVVTIPHNASSHEVRAGIQYEQGSAEGNSITLQNVYSEIPVSVDIIKTEKDSDPVKYLPGAEFTITKLNESNGSVEVAEDGVTPVFRAVEITSSEEATKGKLSFSGLTHGIYEIRETEPPTGYIYDTNMTVYIRVEDGVVTWLNKEKGEGSTVIWTPRASSDSENGIHFTAGTPASEGTEAVNAAFTVPNTPGSVLPSTGGIGGYAHSLAGGLMIALVGAVLLLKRRKKTV